MPRANRRAVPPNAARPVGLARARRLDTFRGVDYVVASVPASDRVYRCPGCDHEIVGVPHVGAWAAEAPDADDRRHWHTPCWAARERRRPTR